MQFNATSTGYSPLTSQSSLSLNAFTLFAAGFLGGAGTTLLASEFAARVSKGLRKSAATTLNAIRASSAGSALATILHNGPPSNKPLTRAEVTSAFAEGTWQRQAYDDYTTTLLDEDRIFPCIYATKGLKTDDQLYLFIDTDDLSDSRHIRALASALAVYLPQSRALGPNTSLVLLAKQNPNPRTMDEYNSGFWALLDGLAKLDEKAWPDDVPKDINTDRWCFCFAGEPFFSVVQTPAHMNRVSRYAKGVTIVFQPKWIFDVLFSSDAKRAGSIAKVRGLLAQYDPVPVSPELKNYGDPDSRESKQYFLLDENVPATCPFSKLGGPKPDSHP